MKGWWVRYKFCICRVDGVQGRRARTAVVTWGFLLNSAVATRPSYLRRLLKGLLRRVLLAQISTGFTQSKAKLVHPEAGIRCRRKLRLFLRGGTHVFIP